MNDYEKIPLDASLEYEGVPEIADEPPPGQSADLADEGMIPPRDWAQAVEGRVTAEEQTEGESLDERLLQEQPELNVGDPSPEEALRPPRLVEPQSEVDQLDSIAEPVASGVPDAGDLSAEESAVHIEGT